SSESSGPLGSSVRALRRRRGIARALYAALEEIVNRMTGPGFRKFSRRHSSDRVGSVATTGGTETQRAPRQGLTIAEIGRLAGVSAPTVSKVINGRSEVGAETRALVQQVLHEQGYQHKKRPAKGSALIELTFHELAVIYPVEIINGVGRVAD